VLRVESLSKHYETPRGDLPILSDISFELAPGAAMSIVGPSGSGKSTLLYIIGTLDPPSSGRVRFDETDPFAFGEAELAAFRNREIGFVFQDHCLLPQCTLVENILIPTLVTEPRRDCTARAKELLDAVGLGDRLEHRPHELSGGERQRAAIARALILEPSLLLCDEPTGNLDRATADTVADVIVGIRERHNTTLVVVTHSASLADRLPLRRRIDGLRLVEA